MNKLHYKYTLFRTSFFPWYEDLWMSSELGFLWLRCSETDFMQQFHFWSSPILAGPQNFNVQSNQWKRS